MDFLATFKLANDTNSIHEGATRLVQPHYVHETLTNALNSRMCAKEESTPIIDSVRNSDTRSLQLLHSYAEVVNYLMNKYAADQAIDEYDAAILRVMHLVIKSLQSYAEDLVAKSCKRQKRLLSISVNLSLTCLKIGF